jgi:hypothetical protein
VKLRQAISFMALTLLSALLCSCAGGVSGAPGGSVTPHNDSPSPPGSMPAIQDEAGVLADSGPSARVIVTRSFSKPAILAETVAIGEDTTALDALQVVARVETKYGGGFVSSIEGISTKYEGTAKEREDWLFYINGISLSTGAGGYVLKDGDSQHWDYHDWSFRQFIPAIIGDFPEPFLHGIRGVVYPTLVAYQSGFEEEARQIADSLGELGVPDVTQRSFVELSAGERETSNLVLVGTGDFEPIEELNEPWNRLGFFGHFEDGALVVFDSAGEVVNEYGAGTGLIQATQSIWNPKGVGAGENVVWVVSGLDEAGVRSAVDILINHHDDYKYACAVVVTEGETLKVPQ